MAITLIRYAERPELWQSSAEISREVWPEYNQHGDVLNRHWGRLFEDFAEFQFVLYDDHDENVLAEGHAAPCLWDGTVEGLPVGIDAALASAVDAHATGLAPTALCALAAEVRPRFRRGGLSGTIIDAMSGFAREAGLAHLIAPVRPSLKYRYPITPIERYAFWTREDGESFDPWIRVHTRRGGTIAKPAPRSMLITGTIAEWEKWAGMRFPDDGQYTFPEGLSPVEIDYGHDLGTYWEPNIWIVHALET
jgi:GNAT superfamily N-acetyltransferase